MCAAFDRYHAFRNFDGPQGGLQKFHRAVENLWFHGLMGHVLLVPGLALGLEEVQRTSVPNTWMQRPTGKDRRHVSGCQNSGPFLDPYYNTAPNI